MITAVHEIGLDTSEPQTLLAMLEACGPFQAIPRDGADWTTVNGPNVRLAVRAIAAEAKRRPVHLQGIAHICLQAPQIVQLIADLAPGGMTPVSPPTDLGTDFRYVYAHDSAGVLYEIEGAPFATVEKPRCWVGHVAYVARDIRALSAFYSAVLERSIDARMRLQGEARFDQVTGLPGVDLKAAWIRGLNIGLEFWQYMTPSTLDAEPGSPLSGWSHVCFETTDPDRTARAILDNDGASLGVSPLPGRAAFSDPEGNVIHLLPASDATARTRPEHEGIVAEISRQLAASQRAKAASAT